MTSSGTNVIQSELTQLDFGQSLGRGNLTRIRRQDPIDRNRLSEIQMGGENADLLDLTLEREWERGVGGRSDVGLLDMEHSGVKSVVGDSVEYGQ